MTKCLRCGAGAEWLEGNVPNQPRACKNCKLLAKEIERLRERERSARIEAAEEFRRRALLACEEEHRFSKDRTRSHPFGARCWSRIAALPALPEEP